MVVPTLGVATSVVPAEVFAAPKDWTTLAAVVPTTESPTPNAIPIATNVIAPRIPTTAASMRRMGPRTDRLCDLNRQRVVPRMPISMWPLSFIMGAAELSVYRFGRP